MKVKLEKYELEWVTTREQWKLRVTKKNGRLWWPWIIEMITLKMSIDNS